jgi:hypothetical protein
MESGMYIHSMGRTPNFTKKPPLLYLLIFICLKEFYNKIKVVNLCRF